MITDRNNHDTGDWGIYLLSCLNTILNQMDSCPGLLRQIPQKFRITLENLSRLYKVRSMLADSRSKTIFDRVVSMYLSIGFLSPEETYALFGLYDEKQWQEYISQAKLLTKHAENDYVLDRVETWILEGYSYEDKCRVADGDVVIDAGAFTGNTALYFQELAGSRGRVYSFEPDPETYRQLKANIEKSGLGNISAFNLALSDKEGVCRFNSTSGAGSCISNSGDVEVSVTTIDKFVETEGIKIDFLKMDIEGAEPEALEGARNAIRDHHPKMAICVYHSNDHLFRIPEIIHAINPNYKFYMRHNSQTLYETVLFCEPAEKPLQTPDVSRDSFGNISNAFMSFRQKLYAVTSRHFFDLVVAHFKANNDAPFEYLDNFQAQQYHYMYMPFLENKDDHFEVLVHEKTIFVAIHFEQPTKNHDKATLESVRGIFASLRKKAPRLALEDTPSRLGCGFALNRAEYRQQDLARITAASLNFLVTNSLPLLWRESLLSVPLIEFTLRTCS